MIAKLEIERNELKNTLNGLSNTTRFQEDSVEDFNLISLSHPNQLKIFVRHFNLFQVVHTLSDSGRISVDVQKDKEMVFNSDMITSLIQKSKSDELNLRFYEDKFAVETRDSWFSTPTTFTLNMFHESQFQSIAVPEGFNQISSIDREELIENLGMMSTVSKVVKLKLTSDEFWVSVSDAVHGQGEVMKSVDPSKINLDEFEHRYRIDIIQTFLKSVNTDMVDIEINKEGVLKVKAEEPGHTAELTLARRLDQQT